MTRTGNENTPVPSENLIRTDLRKKRKSPDSPARWARSSHLFCHFCETAVARRLSCRPRLFCCGTSCPFRKLYPAIVRSGSECERTARSKEGEQMQVGRPRSDMKTGAPIYAASAAEFALRSAHARRRYFGGSCSVGWQAPLRTRSDFDPELWVITSRSNSGTPPWRRCLDAISHAYAGDVPKCPEAVLEHEVLDCDRES